MVVRFYFSFFFLVINHDEMSNASTTTNHMRNEEKCNQLEKK